MAGNYLDPWDNVRRGQRGDTGYGDRQRSRSADGRPVSADYSSSSWQHDEYDDFHDDLEVPDDNRYARRSMHGMPQHSADDNSYYTTGNPYESAANLRYDLPDTQEPRFEHDRWSPNADQGGQQASWQTEQPYQPQMQSHYPQQQQHTAYMSPRNDFAANPTPQPRYDESSQRTNNNYPRPVRIYRVPLVGYHCPSLEAIRGGIRYISHLPDLDDFNICPTCYDRVVLPTRLGDYFMQARCEPLGPPCDMANISIRRHWNDMYQRNIAKSDPDRLLNTFGRNAKTTKGNIRTLKASIRTLHEEIKTAERQQSRDKLNTEMARFRAAALARQGQPGRLQALRNSAWEDAGSKIAKDQQLKDKHNRYRDLTKELWGQTDLNVQYAGRPLPKKKKTYGAAGTGAKHDNSFLTKFINYVKD